MVAPGTQNQPRLFCFFLSLKFSLSHYDALFLFTHEPPGESKVADLVGCPLLYISNMSLVPPPPQARRNAAYPSRGWAQGHSVRQPFNNNGNCLCSTRCESRRFAFRSGGGEVGLCTNTAAASARACAWLRRSTALAPRFMFAGFFAQSAGLEWPHAESTSWTHSRTVAERKRMIKGRA